MNVGRVQLHRLLCVMVASWVCAASAQTSAQDEIAKYRQMLADGNPAELTEARGEDLWTQKRGPRQASLERCDLGLGPGVIKGANAQLPRYFADANRVMDLEARLVYCMETLQGIPFAEATRRPFSDQGQPPTDMESIVAYVVAASRGAKISVPQSHPMEKAAYRRGELAFYYRGGPFDFSCASCHGSDGQRIRLQDLPNIAGNKEAAQRAFSTWPAYRVSQGAVRTMQWRLYDCFRQQRFPELKYTSQTSIDLITYLGVKASGGTMDAPAIKR
ncbi:MAG TPA: sulfur oxidation c-type cytochrome SoxA [Burkholderiaceae bacterium]|nr:sulfur oxidation c-type cytochrome SoxA [Burkholderiaceae bacterium]